MKATTLTKETITDLGVIDRGFPDFRVGDTIEVMIVVKEGNKERLQAFAGDVITFKRKDITSVFTVRRIGANGVGVEKIFPYFAPTIDSIKILKRGRVRRAKLYYVRERIGKSARIQEHVLTKEQKLQAQAKLQESRDESQNS